MKSQRNRILICCAIILSGLTAGVWVLVGLPGSFSRVGFTGFLLLSVLIIFAEAIGGTLMWVIQDQLNPKHK